MKIITIIVASLVAASCVATEVTGSAEQAEACLTCYGDETGGGAEPISPSDPIAYPVSSQTGDILRDDIQCRHVPTPTSGGLNPGVL